MDIGLIILLFFVVIIIIVGLLILGIVRYGEYELPQVRAGKYGEKKATEAIKRILREKDILLTNINVQYEDKVTELDNVIINNNGVFIIEVKNYSGELIGAEDDYEWTKIKQSSGGNIYEKQVRNPIKQVKRQIYILAKYLRYYGVDVWVEGYVLLIHNNSPVDCERVLESYEDIDKAIHRRTKNLLNQNKVLKIQELLT